MSDLEPVISELQTVDPYVARVLVRQLRPESDFRYLGATGTSCSIVAIDEVSNVIRQLEFEHETLMDRIRCEVVLMTDGDGSNVVRPLRDRSTGLVRPRRFGKPTGDRACVLAEAVQRSSNEFIVICGPGEEPLTGLAEILGHMWTEGADIGILAAGDPPRCEDGDDLDAAAAVPGWLGIGGRSTGSTVVLRRWFARWIFNEMERALDPAEEIADRIRLLGTIIICAPAGRPVPPVVEAAS